jgi:hypothetical protein
MSEHDKKAAEPPPAKPKKKKPATKDGGAGNARKNRAMKPEQATFDGAKVHDG